MIIKHSPIDIPGDDPFSNCKLGREKYADVLTDIINSYSDGFVLAINNRWGTGKTTFVRMWEQKLKNLGYKTIYFNAWENDFEDNPLTALMGELKTLTNESSKQKFGSTLKKAAILSKHIAPIIAQAIANKYIDVNFTKEGIVGVTEGMTGIFENDVNEYAEKKKNIKDFKQSLSEFISKTNDGKPLLFVIDELDRCRPNYAVSILEQIKHFFSVKNIVFVLSIDKTQLGNAVKGVYGSDSIDSEEYLKRFIDVEYSIPDPEEDAFYNYLVEYFKFQDFFHSDERKQFREFESDFSYFLKISKLLFTKRSIPLRQQEKIFSLARIGLRSFNYDNYVIPHIFLLLAFLKIKDPGFYDNLKNKKLSIIEAQKNFLDLVSINKNSETENELIWLEVYLVHFYNNYLEPWHSRNKLYNYNSTTSSNQLLIDSIINKEKNSNFLSILENLNRQGQDNLDLGFFFSKLELLENFKT